MFETAKTLLLEADSMSAITYLAEQPDSLEVVKIYNQLVRELYWQEKDLPTAIMMARAGMQYGLCTAALETASPKIYELKSGVKVLAYDLASFTWPGWDEADIEIGPSDLVIGLDAAKTNVRLGHELDKGGLALSRAYWMAGGHYLATDRYSQAKVCYHQATTYATTAEAEGERLLAEGFLALTQLWTNPDDGAMQVQLGQLKQALAEVGHGEQFVQQLETAERVFGEE